MKAFVLTYHSHHVVGPDYATNDHIAFPEDLKTIGKCGFRIVSLSKLVASFDFLEGQTQALNSRDEKYVALTFDDGPSFDVDDFIHPQFGKQSSFLNAMVHFRDCGGLGPQPELHATSFVIASPGARRIMEDTADPQYTFLTPGSMTDEWWSRALDTGLIAIANHSWDHLHPALPAVAHSRQARGDFSQVDNDHDADAQIRDASVYIDSKTGGRLSPFFAYPFGHYNNFLVQDYFPRRGAEIGIDAAFTTRPSPIIRGDIRWSLPRLTCGDHWTSTDALIALLMA